MSILREVAKGVLVAVVGFAVIWLTGAVLVWLMLQVAERVLR